jgi:hypothetical protein
MQAMVTIGKGKYLLRLKNYAKVTLSGGLILAGTDNPDEDIRGIWVDANSEFIMNSGELSGIKTNEDGSVMMVWGGTFTMNGGKISGNSVIDFNGRSPDNISGNGGGVFVYNGTFIMNGGEISGNTISSPSPWEALGGGVYIHGGIFIMKAGKISGNSVSSSSLSAGGGVCVLNGTFIMEGGEISGNTVFSLSAPSYGGAGIFITNSSFAKSGGTIYGYNSLDPNSNRVEDSDGIVDGYGHAVYYDSTHYKDTTMGPEHNLTANYPNDGEFSGW